LQKNTNRVTAALLAETCGWVACQHPLVLLTWRRFSANMGRWSVLYLLSV